VLAIAFCDRELSNCSTSSRYASSQTKFVAVEYGDQHATSVRSPERRRSTHQLCALLSTMVKIETIKNGPYVVTGEVELIDADGNKFPDEKRMALCRCGASTEKPFCDGTHSKIGFKAAEKAVPESKE
jgi:CDGSH-type Zn-finger protein